MRQMDNEGIFQKSSDILRKDGVGGGFVGRFGEFVNLIFIRMATDRMLADPEWSWEILLREDVDILERYNVMLSNIRKNHPDMVPESTVITKSSTLENMVDIMDGMDMSVPDPAGDAFEFFASQSSTGGLGEFYTPMTVVSRVLELVNPMPFESIYDPCCGTGRFLTEAKRMAPGGDVHGREITDTSRIARMNLFLSGHADAKIVQMDSLSRRVRGEYDIVVTNYPFSQKTEYGVDYGFSTEDANPVFMAHVVDACRKGGRIGVIVPEGMLYRTNRWYVKARRKIAEECRILEVVSVDPSVFEPYTGQPTGIIYAEKGGRTTSVFMTGLADEKTTVDMDGLSSMEWNLSPMIHCSKKPPDHWIPLGDIFDMVPGKTPSRKNKEFWDGGIPWVMISDMRGSTVCHTKRTITKKAAIFCNMRKIPKGTLLMSFKLTLGKTSIAGKDIYTNEAIAALFPKDEEKYPDAAKHLVDILPCFELGHGTHSSVKGKSLNLKMLAKIRIPPMNGNFRMRMDLLNDESEALERRLVENRKLKRNIVEGFLERNGGRKFVKDRAE